MCFLSQLYIDTHGLLFHEPAPSRTRSNMRVASVLCSIASTALCTGEADVNELIDILVKQNARLTAAADALREDLFQLQQTYNALFLSTAVERHEQARWQRETSKQLASLAGRRTLVTAASTQPRELSQGACADASAPQLLVEGVCSCTEGLLLQGRNVSKELDELKSAKGSTAAVTATITTTATASTVREACERHNDTLPTIGWIEDNNVLDGANRVIASPDEQFVYAVAHISNSFVVINVSTPTNPFIVANITGDTTHFDHVTDLAIMPDGDYILAACILCNALTVVNVTSPAHVDVVTTFSISSPKGISLSQDGKTAYVSTELDYLYVIDISDLTSPTVIGSVASSTHFNDAHAVTLSPEGNTAYVTGVQSDSVAAVDVSDPSDPTVLGSIRGSSALDLARWVGVSPSREIVFVTAQNSAMFAVVNMSDPTAPELVSTLAFATCGCPIEVSSDDTVAYTACDGAIQAIDVTTDVANMAVLRSSNTTTVCGLALSANGSVVFSASSSQATIFIFSTCKF